MTAKPTPMRRAPLVAAIVMIAAVLALVAQPVAAQEKSWENLAELYLMGAAMSGTIGAGSLDTTIDVPSSSIFENLKFAALADYRGQSPKWAIGADVVYMNLGGSGNGPVGKGSADIGAEEFIVDLMGAYRFSNSFEALAGLRYTGLRTTLKVYAPNSYREASVSKGWVDPFVGAQAFLPLGKGFQFQARGDVGGFGVGCKFTWQATLRLNWQVSRSIRLGLGYRWLDQDYDSGSGADYFKWDVLTQGPLMAAGMTF